MKTLLRIGAVLFISTLAVASGYDPERFSEEAANTAKTRKKAILEEIEKLGSHEWAGVYYTGDGEGMNIYLTIAPSSGYVFEWQGCEGLYDRNYGSVFWAGDRVRLSFAFENEREGFKGIAPEFVPVPWGERRYLIPADKIIRFCNSFTDGSEPRTNIHGFYLLREGDENKEAAGLPKVPDEYLAYLLAKPIEAKLLSVGSSVIRTKGEWKFKDTPVTIDAGMDKGVRVGMKLFVTTLRDRMDSVRITEVETDHSEGIMTQRSAEDPDPKQGWRLSTQEPWNILDVEPPQMAPLVK